MAFAKFMSSAVGRLVRVVAGIALLYVGYTMHSLGGNIVIFVGALALLAGSFDFCAFAPLFGAPFSGKEIRSSK